MPTSPLSEFVAADLFKNIRLVATDMDGTLTQLGKFTPALLQAYSNVQCHIKPLRQDKAAGLLQVLREFFPQYTPEQVLTVGDSPNDETLFDPSYFPVSVGVANVLDYASQLTHQPAYVTTSAEGEGFCELARYLLDQKSFNVKAENLTRHSE